MRPDGSRTVPTMLVTVFGSQPSPRAPLDPAVPALPPTGLPPVATLPPAPVEPERPPREGLEPPASSSPLIAPICDDFPPQASNARAKRHVRAVSTMR